MIETDRLILRGWRVSDIAPFHAAGQNAEVMQFLGPPPTLARPAEVVDRQSAILEERGYCFWALENQADGAFIGFCGVKPGIANAPIAGQAEIGWRLARPYWSQGYAQEAARASLAWMWINTGEPLVAAITVKANVRSRKLMERLGMTHCPGEEFDHPILVADDPLGRHVVTGSIAR